MLLYKKLNRYYAYLHVVLKCFFFTIQIHRKIQGIVRCVVDFLPCLSLA